MFFISGYLALYITGKLLVLFSFVNTDLICWFSIICFDFTILIMALLSSFLETDRQPPSCYTLKILT